MNQNDFRWMEDICTLSSLKIVQLRGHHLKELYRCYEERNKYKYLEDIMSHPYVIRYGFHFGRAVLTVFEGIIFKFDTEIEFVEGLDSICSACEKKGNPCLRKELMDEDKKELSRYGFKIGEKYSSKDLMQRLLEVNS